MTWLRPARKGSSVFASVRRLTTVIGIESSCDDTGVALVDSSRNIIAETVVSQLATVNKLGGVIPTVANRLHAKNLPSALSRVMTDSGLSWREIDHIAVATRPGLAICLREGVSFANKLAKKHDKQVISVHHMKAHALTGRLMAPDLQFPFLSYLLSGGHCLLVWARGPADFEILGHHQGISPGEFFDKISRRLRLRHLPGFGEVSGGSAIEVLAAKGDPLRWSFAGHARGKKSACISFGGLYTTTISRICKAEGSQGVRFGHIADVEDFCAVVQHAVFARLGRCLQAGIEYVQATGRSAGKPSLVLSGGVACNEYIREGLAWIAQHYGMRTFAPPPRLCTDNGVMIAWAGIESCLDNSAVFHESIDVVDAVKPFDPVGFDISTEVPKVLASHCFAVEISKTDFARYFVRHRRPGQSLLQQ